LFSNRELERFLSHSQIPGAGYIPAQSPRSDYSNATRHLCAGAYLDEEFRRRSLAEVFYQSRRVVAPSHGFELAPVLWHCLRARNIALIRDCFIVGVLVVALCAYLPAGLVVIGLLIVQRMVTSAWNLLRDTVRQVRNGGIGTRMIVVRAVLLLMGLYLGSFALILIFGAVGAYLSLLFASSAVGGDSIDLVGPPLVILFVLGVVFALPVAANLVVQRELDQLGPGRPRPSLPAHRRFTEIARQQDGNTVVYGDFTPFVGAGFELPTWNFAQRLIRPAKLFVEGNTDAEREFDVAPFSAVELVHYVREQLAALSVNAEPERQLPGLVVVDRVFQAGTEVAYLNTATPASIVDTIIRNPTSPTRHYLMCQVVSWRGEVVTTVYVHVALQGKMLYLEFTPRALTPCDDRFRVIDKVGGTGPTAFVRAAWRGLVDAPRTIGLAPVNLVRATIDGIAASAAGATPTSVARGYDYGATVSVRELASTELRTHVQLQDIVKYQRLIERRVLAAAQDFLELRGVDIAEYRQRAMNVLSAGIVNTGGGSVNVHGDVRAQTDVRGGGQA
jgi:hypothetical protein